MFAELQLVYIRWPSQTHDGILNKEEMGYKNVVIILEEFNPISQKAIEVELQELNERRHETANNMAFLQVKT